MRWSDRVRPLSGLAVALVGAVAGCASNPSVPADGARTRVESRRGDAPAPSALAPEEIVLRHTEALALLEAEDYAAAEPMLEDIVAAAPALVAPRVNLALLYVRTDRLGEAQAALEAVLKQHPDSVAARTQLGVVLRMRGEFAASEAAYLAALATDDTYANAHYNLGVLYDLYLQRPRDALAHYERYQALAGGEDTQVAKWIVDLGRRYGDATTAEALTE